MWSVAVALFTRAWIEIMSLEKATDLTVVALFTRAWIEISSSMSLEKATDRRPLYEGVD